MFHAAGSATPTRRVTAEAANYRGRVDVRRVTGGIGRTLIAAGVLILLFVAYQLFGTNLAEQASQKKLKKSLPPEVVARANAPSTTTTTGPGPTTTTTFPPGPAPPPSGEALAILRLPRIGIEKAIVQGVGLDDLKKGPGHYPDTPQPGQPGNSAIAGHRTTYGAPFFRLNEMQPGDPIFVTTAQGAFEYDVRNTKVVSPNDVSVLKPSTDNLLTLTTCNPRFSASQRLVLIATLKGPAAPASPPPEPAKDNVTSSTTIPGAGNEAPALTPSGGLSGKRSARTPALLWGLLAAAIWVLAWLVGRLRPRLKWPAYFVGTPLFLLVLFVFFENFSRLLPANF